jgi:hypothetical protein
VPRISEFYGIVIAMYFRDHNPPHVHARYAGQEAKVSISTGEVLEGELPGRAQRLVREWTDLHRQELELNWERARSRMPLVTIDPLP